MARIPDTPPAGPITGLETIAFDQDDETRHASLNELQGLFGGGGGGTTSLPTASISFPRYNRFASSISVLKQSTANFPGLFVPAGTAAGEGTFFATIQIPFYRYKDDKGVRMIGNANGAAGSSGRFTLSYFMPGYNVASYRGRARFSFGPNYAGGLAGLTTRSLLSAVLPFDCLAGFFFFIFRSANIMRLDALRLDDFTILQGDEVIDTTAGIQADGYTGNFFYIGDAQTTEPDSLLSQSAAPAAFFGRMGQIGYYNGVMTAANAVAIAQGAAAKDELPDAANKLTYFRQMNDLLTGIHPLAAGTADLTTACEVIGANHMRPGSTLIRQSAAKYLRFTSLVRDGHVHARPARGQVSSGAIPVQVEKAGLGGQVEVAAFNQANVNMSGWIRLQDENANLASGQITAPIGSYFLIARDEDDHDFTAIDHSERRIGARSIVWSQSPIGIGLNATTRGDLYSGTGAVSISRYIGEDESKETNTHIMTPGAFEFGDGPVALAMNWERRFPGVPLELVSAADSGTTNIDALYDANPDRQWAEMIDLLDDSGGRRISSLCHSHGNSESGYQEEFAEIVFEALFDGDPPDLSGGNSVTIGATTYSIANGNADQVPAPDHFVFDGDLEGDFNVSISPVNRANTAAAAGQYEATRNEAYEYLESKAGRFITGPEMGLMTTGGNAGPAAGPHPDETHEFGTPYLGAYIAELIARAEGLSDFQDPSIEALALNAAQDEIIGQIFMANGGKLMTADDATWGNLLQGFEISEDAGATWTDYLGRDPDNGFAVTGPVFTASLSGNRSFTLARGAGQWAAAVQVRYLHGTPIATPDPANDEAARPTMGALFDNRAVWDRGAAGMLGNPVRKMLATAVAP